jgi:GT2 family glycosyltransferase
MDDYNMTESIASSSSSWFSSPSLYAPHITGVTVTYGARWHYLRQTMHAAQREGVQRMIVVDNGSVDPIASLVQTEFDGFGDVVTLPKNTGSAGGFKRGIRRALQFDSDFLLLLDDDNEIQDGSLNALSAAYHEYARFVHPGLLAMLAYRPDRQADVAGKVPANGMDDDRSAFFGFNLRDLPFKLFRRTHWGQRWIADREPVAQVDVAVAPYSGLYFHRSVPEMHGLPDERFLLYADDTEFSFRLTRNGGKIVLVTDAKLVDLESSWNVRTRYSNTFDALLQGDGDFRAYYSTRNNAYFERWMRDRNGWLRSLNRSLYLTALRLRAKMTKRQQRFHLLLNAIRDGEAGRLGEHPNFPL